MSEEYEKIGMYCPSYARAETTTTFKILPELTYVVRKSEEQAYRNAGVEKIWAVEDSEIDNLCKVSNYIIDNAPENIIFTVDDDTDWKTMLRFQTMRQSFLK